MPKIFLSDTFVQNVQFPTDKSQEFYWDHPTTPDGKVLSGSVTGLGLRVTAMGNKAFVHAYAFNGQRRRMVLGSPPVLNVASARLAVGTRERQISSGESPDLAIDPRKKHALTVRDAIEQYWQSHISSLSPGYQYNFTRFMAGWLKAKPRTITRRGNNIRKRDTDFGTLFGDRILATIKPLDIEGHLKQFRSPYGYNSSLCQVTALFNWVIRMQLVDMRNPCHPIKKAKIIRQRRDYTMEQIRMIAAHIFHPVLDTLPETDGFAGMAKRDTALVKARLVTANDQMLELCNYMGILFLTMARPSDLTNAEFAHFDLERLIWHKHNTKGIKLSRAAYEYAYRSVPIHPQVAEMVRNQQRRWPEAALVFPSHRDQSQPRDNFQKGLTRFKSLPGVPAHFQLYDLKRIAISLMLTGQGVSREAVSHYVDHKGNLETTMIYDLGLVDPLRPVSDHLGALVLDPNAGPWVNQRSANFETPAVPHQSTKD